jgi:hypothetical protein
LILSFCTYVSAQESNVKYSKWKVGIQINSPDKTPSLLDFNNPNDNRIYSDGVRKNKSFAFGIQANYFFSENSFFRIRAGITFNNIYEQNDDTITTSGFLNKSYIHISNKNFFFSPGIFLKKDFDRFDVFCGFEIPYILYGQVKDTMSFEQYDRTADTLSSYVYSNAKSDKGFATGPAFTLGFNIHLSQHFSLGGEASAGFFYSKTGKISTVIVTSPGPTIVTGKFKDSTQTFFLPIERFSLNFNFSF